MVNHRACYVGSERVSPLPYVLSTWSMASNGRARCNQDSYHGPVSQCSTIQLNSMGVVEPNLSLILCPIVGSNPTWGRMCNNDKREIRLRCVQEPGDDVR